jgi:hypothetical protein
MLPAAFNFITFYKQQNTTFFLGIFASRLVRSSVYGSASTHTFRWTTLLFGDRNHKQYKMRK